MKKLGMALGIFALGATGVVVGNHSAAEAKNGEGHTPVVVCHWVPAAPGGAHETAAPGGGSYVVIVVDDDSANGNKNLKGHAGHENDIIGQGTSCDGFIPE